jgi:hypothetical protein
MFRPLPSIWLTYNSYFSRLGFQIVKAILPVTAAGLGVGVAVGWGGLVGLGVDVGPLLVGVELGVSVGVAVSDARGVWTGVLDGVDVLRTSGVQVGVAVVVNTGTLSAAGMIKICPARMRATSVMLFASARADTSTL